MSLHVTYHAQMISSGASTNVGWGQGHVPLASFEKLLTIVTVVISTFTLEVMLMKLISKRHFAAVMMTYEYLPVKLTAKRCNDL